MASWNVRTLLNIERETELMMRRTAVVSKQLERLNIDIAGLQETRLEGEGVKKEENFTIFWSGVKAGERRQSGVAFAIRNEIVERMVDTPRGINERIITVRIPLKRGRFASVICVYAPTMSNTAEIKEQFYRKLTEVIENIAVEDKLIILGDLNARVGSDNRIHGPVIGKFGKGNRNSNGEMLINFCAQFDLIITNTYFKQPERNYYTWKHPRSKDYHLLDYVIIRREHRTDIMNTKAMRGPECDTDHYLVSAKFQFQIAQKKRKKATTLRGKLNVKSLKNPITKTELQEEITRKMSHLERTDDLNKKWGNLKGAIQDASKSILGYTHKKNQDWFDDNKEEITEILEKRKQAYNNLLNRETRIHKEEFKKIKTEAQRKSRELKNKWWTEKAEKLERMANVNDMQGFYGELKQIYGHKPNIITPIKNADNSELLTNKEKIITRWKEHFQSLFNIEGGTDEQILQQLNAEPPLHNLTNDISLVEVEQAIKSMRDSKSPGSDGLPAEIFKHAGVNFKRELLDLYRTCWEQEKVPKEFKDAQIVTIFKKGDKTMCGNYRGISLLSVAGKIYSKIILNRLKTLSEKILPESQSGFRSKRSTNDMIFSIRQLQEKAMEQKQDLYIAFFDFKKAFDTVNREMLWKVLTILGCPQKFVNIVKDFHENTEANILISGTTSDNFEVRNGVRQGDPAAPTYFTLYLTAILRVLENMTNEGVYIRTRSDGKLFNLARLKAKTRTRTILLRELLYADDAAMVSLTREGIQEITALFASITRDFGLQINITKTEVMFQASNGEGNFDDPNITINGETLQVTDKFKYLGSYITNNNNIDEEVAYRIQVASSAYGKLQKRLWNNRNITLTTKLKVFKAVVLTALLYSIETMTLYKKHIRKFNAFQMRHLRKFMNIQWTDKISNIEVLRRAGMPSVEALITKMQLRWTGHVIRMEEENLPKILLYGEFMEGRRNVGRQKLRYKDVIKRHISNAELNMETWEDLAKERQSWRRVLVETVEKVEERQESIYERRRQARRGLIVSNKQCERCRRAFISNAGKASHLRANKCT